MDRDKDEVVSGVVFKKDKAGGGSVFMARSTPEPQAETGATFFEARSLLVRLLWALGYYYLHSFYIWCGLVEPRVDAVLDVFYVVSGTEDYLNLLLHVPLVSRSNILFGSYLHLLSQPWRFSRCG